jgi:hypothetical protein
MKDANIQVKINTDELEDLLSNTSCLVAQIRNSIELMRAIDEYTDAIQKYVLGKCSYNDAINVFRRLYDGVEK